MSSNKPSQPTDRITRRLGSNDDTLHSLLHNIWTEDQSDQSNHVRNLLLTRAGPQDTTPASRDRSDHSTHALGLLPRRSGPQETTSASVESMHLLISVALQQVRDLMDDDLSEIPPEEKGSGQ
jgi:hypothetical protein